MARDRRDPYRKFKFRVLIGGVALGGLAAAVGIVRKLFTRVERRYPGVYVEEMPTGTRPIEGVGTSTAGFVGRTPRKRKPRHSTTRPRP